MSELTHRVGETYQGLVKNWLKSSPSLLGFEVRLFGDAYDITRKACTLNDVTFDFSLVLHRDEVTQHVVYVECKYRNEKKASDVNRQFKRFLKRAYQAVADTESDEADSAVFVFTTTVPPDGWREFLRTRKKWWVDNLPWDSGAPNDAILAALVERVHVLVLSAALVKEG